MTNTEWEKMRSSFNHGWLKNRFIASLLRCNRVLSGLVQDDNAQSDLLDLLIGWEAVRPSAVQVLLEMESRVSNALDPLSSDSLALGEATCRYLLEVDRLRWLHLANAEKLVKDAWNALDEFDDVITRARTLFQGPDKVLDAQLLGSLEERARRLGALFSSLTLCHDSILTTDEYVC